MDHGKTRFHACGTPGGNRHHWHLDRLVAAGDLSGPRAGCRAQCQNNLKQWSLAVINYENNYNIFPQACTFQNNDPVPGGTSFGVPMYNWVISVLPFTEHSEVYKEFILTQPISTAAGTPNAIARARVLPEMLCPSDAGHNRQPFMGSQGSQTGALGDNWARGNYRRERLFRFSRRRHTRGFGLDRSEKRRHHGMRIALTVQKITDGLSHTVLLGNSAPE